MEQVAKRYFLTTFTRNQKRVFEVIAISAHERDEHIVAERKLACVH
jgi:hypothetical protein